MTPETRQAVERVGRTLDSNFPHMYIHLSPADLRLVLAALEQAEQALETLAAGHAAMMAALDWIAPCGDWVRNAPENARAAVDEYKHMRERAEQAEQLRAGWMATAEARMERIQTLEARVAVLEAAGHTIASHLPHLSLRGNHTRPAEVRRAVDALAPPPTREEA